MRCPPARLPGSSLPERPVSNVPTFVPGGRWHHHLEGAHVPLCLGLSSVYLPQLARAGMPERDLGWHKLMPASFNVCISASHIAERRKKDQVCIRHLPYLTHQAV